MTDHELQRGDQVTVTIPQMTYVRRGHHGGHVVKSMDNVTLSYLPSDTIIESIKPFDEVGRSPQEVLNVRPESVGNATSATDSPSPLRVGQVVDVQFRTKVVAANVYTHGTVLVQHPTSSLLRIRVPIDVVTVVDDPPSDTLGTIRRHDETGMTVINTRNCVATDHTWCVIKRGTHIPTSRFLSSHMVTAALGWRVVGDVSALLADE